MLNVNDVTRLYLGIQGENGARTITIDVSPWLVAHPGGSVTIWHKRNGDATPSATGAVFDDEAGTISWTPTGTDTYVSGEGDAEIRLTEGSVIKKSRAVKTGVSPSVTYAGTPLGSDWQSYIDAVDGIRSAAVTAKQASESAASDSEAYAIGTRGGEDVESDDPAYHNNSKYYEGLAAEYATDAENAKDAILGMTVSANQLPEGSSPTAVYNDGHMTFGIPKGDHGYITSETEKYQESVSGTVVPTGTWLDERPNLTQGRFLWIKRTRVWNGGTTTVSYEAYYTAVDGESSTLTIDSEPTQGSQGVPRSGGTYTMIQTKAAKVASATSGNFAGLDENGDLTDSGKKASDFAEKTDTVLNTTLSRGRSENSTEGTGSIAFGDDVTASGPYSIAEGSETEASGYFSHAEGYNTRAVGECSHAEGAGTHARDFCHAFGKYNVRDIPKGYSNTKTYQYGDIVTFNGRYYKCTSMSSTGENPSSSNKWTQVQLPDAKYLEIVGNGSKTELYTEYSNARALDMDGNEYLKGDLYIGCDTGSENGKKVIADVMTGATASEAGAKGLVPAPASGRQNYVLRGNGNWTEALEPIYPSTSINIPESGNSVTYSMEGITSSHMLILWNFSSSPENAPPANLEWSTGAGTFTIENAGGTTSEKIRPVFIKAKSVNATIVNS